jgi:hypothetical protein
MLRILEINRMEQQCLPSRTEILQDAALEELNSAVKMNQAILPLGDTDLLTKTPVAWQLDSRREVSLGRHNQRRFSKKGNSRMNPPAGSAVPPPTTCARSATLQMTRKELRGRS